MDVEALLESYNPAGYERVVALSPHLDDAALGCCALLERAARATVCVNTTVCCGDATIEPQLRREPTDADALRAHLGPADARRNEDKRAMRELGANYVHLGFADALHRRSPTTGDYIYDSPRGKWDEPRIDDATHIEQLFVVMRRICGNMGETLLVAPLGIGFHIDHAVAAHVALRLRGEGIDVIFYEDFPYCIDPDIGTNLADTPSNAAERLGESLGTRLALPLNVERKIEILRTYESQFPLLFDDVADIEDSLASRRYDDAPAEFFWTLD